MNAAPIPFDIVSLSARPRLRIVPPPDQLPTYEMLRQIGSQVALIYKRQEEQKEQGERVEIGVGSLGARMLALNEAVASVATDVVKLSLDMADAKGTIKEHGERIVKLEVDHRKAIREAAEKAKDIVSSASAIAADLIAVASDKAVAVLDEAKRRPLIASSSDRTSIPPQVADLGKVGKSGSFTWDENAMSAVIVGMRDQLDEYEQEKKIALAVAATEKKAKEDAERKAKEDGDHADKRSARLRGWIAILIAGLVLLGGAFGAYAKLVASSERPPATAPAK